MAPSKASKRANSTVAAAPSPKKSRVVDPVFEGIVATLQNADGLNEHCREMLIAMATPSLSKAKSERHEMQQLGVEMIQEALQAHKGQLIEAVAVAQKGLTNLEASKSALLQRVDAAKATLGERESAKTAAHTAHEEAQASTVSAEGALKEALKSQEKAEDAQDQLEKEKAAIQAVYEEHYKAPVDSNQGPHHNFLKPFLEKLSLEESLIQALPSSCVKTAEQRGGFDELVISELGKSFVNKITSLENGVQEGASTVSDRKAAFAASQEALETQKLNEQAAAADLQAATTALSEAEVELSQASEEWTAFEPRVKEATDNYNFHDGKRQEFEDGTLKSFEDLRDKETPIGVETEAATAGA